MQDSEYTIDDLARATGFTKRQIRFYITKKLVAGAGDRGPNAVYSEETLLRLRAIAHLKDAGVPPTGRTMTLEEIGHALDSFSSAELEAMVSGTASLKALDTPDDRRREDFVAHLEAPGPGPDIPQPDESSARDYLKSIRSVFEHRERRRPPDAPAPSAPRGAPDDRPRVGSSGPAHRPADMVFQACNTTAPRTGYQHDTEILALLAHLRTLLEKLGRDPRYLTQEGLEQWQRITADGIEIHVRQPRDHPAKARLAALARALQRLLDGEE